MSQESPNADLNGRIAKSILSCFQPELFDSTGLFCSMWLMRLVNAANDAQGMLDELLSNDRPSQSEQNRPGNRTYLRSRKRLD